jgi:hypothetical protein
VVAWSRKKKEKGRLTWGRRHHERGVEVGAVVAHGAVAVHGVKKKRERRRRLVCEGVRSRRWAGWCWARKRKRELGRRGRKEKGTGIKLGLDKKVRVL